MKNVEKKELLELLNLIIKNDCQKDLLLLIENGVVDKIMCQSKYWQVRAKLASKGYVIDILIKDKVECVRYCAYEWLINNNKLEQKYIDLAIQQDDIDVLFLFIKNKIVDERMCQSKHLEVREKLARQGYFIDILIKDKSSYVLLKIYEWLIKNNKLEQKYIELAIQQDKYSLLTTLIKNKIVNERMCQSEHWEVREELAMNGYFIEVLINDNDNCIRHRAYEWLILKNKLEQKHIEQLFFNKDYEVLQCLVNSGYKNDLINKDKFLQKIKEFQAEYEDNLSLLINYKDILKKQ